MPVTVVLVTCDCVVPVVMVVGACDGHVYITYPTTAMRGL